MAAPRQPGRGAVESGRARPRLAARCGGSNRSLLGDCGLTLAQSYPSRMMPEGAPMQNEFGANDVIVADNDSIIRGILRSVLEAEGFTVLQAVNGVEALNFAVHTHARLIILDYRMPKLDGLTCCMHIRALDGYADVPIVILTAFDDAGIRDGAARAGATAFLAKPFKPIDLLRTIAQLEGHSPTGLAEPATLVWD